MALHATLHRTGQNRTRELGFKKYVSGRGAEVVFEWQRIHPRVQLRLIGFVPPSVGKIIIPPPQKQYIGFSEPRGRTSSFSERL